MDTKFFILFFYIFNFFSYAFCENFDSLIDTANEYYEKGAAKDLIEQRKMDFNLALYFYLKASEIDPENSDLDLTIGSLFFELNQYPLSLLYYYRAFNHGAQKSDILPLFELANKEAGISKTNLSLSFFKKNLLFIEKNYHFIFYWLMGGVILIILNTWFRKKIFSYGIYFFLSISVVFLTFSMISYYNLPLEGVLVKSIQLYNPETQSYFSDPLLAGVKVQVLESEIDSNWIKIKDPENRVGYLPFKSLRMII